MLSFRLHPALRNRVQAIEVVERSGGEVTVLPGTAAVLGFQYRGRVRAGEQLLSAAGVTGIQSGPRRYGYEHDTGSVLVRFTVQGAACLGVPLSQLAGRSVPLDAILPAGRVREASQRLLDATSLSARVDVVQGLLAELPFVQDALVARAIERLAADRGEPARVAMVARELGLGERQLERRFLSRVGITPKSFSKLRRFERAVALAKSACSLGRLALDAGYYDQSHFIREFRRYAGAPPGALFASSR